MARHRLTKEEQVKGISKALANSKTPKQFIPGLYKRLNRLVGRSQAESAVRAARRTK